MSIHAYVIVIVVW